MDYAVFDHTPHVFYSMMGEFVLLIDKVTLHNAFWYKRRSSFIKDGSVQLCLPNE